MAWWDDALHAVGNAIGGAVHGVENFVGGVGQGINQGAQQVEHFVQQAPQNIQHFAQQAPRYVPPQLAQLQRLQMSMPKVNIAQVLSQMPKYTQQFGLNQLNNFAKSQLTPQQYQHLLQTKSPVEGIKLGLQNEIQPTNIARNMAIPLSAITHYNNAVLGAFGNQPINYENVINNVGGAIANAPGVKQLRQAPGIQQTASFVNDNLAKPISKSVGRLLNVTSGTQKYDSGIKGYSQYGTDLANIGSLAYTPAKAGVMSQAFKTGGIKAVAPYLPGALARGFGSGAGVNALYQAGEKGINNIDIPQVLGSGAFTAAANAGLPLAPGIVGKLLGNFNHSSKTVSNLVPDLQKQAQGTVQGGKAYTQNLIDNAAQQFRAGKISEKQLTALVRDNYQQTFKKNPMPADIQGYVDAIKGVTGRPYAQMLKERTQLAANGQQPKLPFSASIAENFVRDTKGKYAKNVNPELEQLKKYQAEQINVISNSHPNSSTHIGAIKNFQEAQRRIDAIERPRAIAETAPKPNQPQLPKGFKVTENGDVVNIKTGKVATPHDLENAVAGKNLNRNELLNFDQQNANLATHGRKGAPVYETAPKPSKQRGFITTVKESPMTTPEVATKVSGKYNVLDNRETLASASKSAGLDTHGNVVNEKSFEKAIVNAKKSEDYSTETQAQSIQLIRKLQEQGRTDDAVEIVEKMSERATKAGQASQILSAYNNLSPEGVLVMAQRSIDKAKKDNPAKYKDLKISPEQAAALKGMAEKLQGLTGDERIIAQKKLLDEIGRLVPTPTITKAVTIWKAGLLTGLKGGVSGNTVGNGANILIKKISDAPAATIDTVISAFTHNRSKTFTLKNYFSGMIEGTGKAYHAMRTGVGADELSNKLDYKQTYFSKNPLGRAAQAYTDFVFNFYSAADKPFKMAALKNSLTDLAMTEAKNKGLKGSAYRKFVADTVASPPDSMLVRATNDSLDATFQDKTALGAALGGFKRGLADKGPLQGAVGEVIAPFTGVPSSVATKLYHYSLISSSVDVVRAIKASNVGQFDQNAQRTLVESLGKGLTGTGLLGVGYGLWNAGLMTTGMPTDPKERALWEMEGKQPWSVKVGNQWLSLNYTGPLLAVMGAGAQAAQSVAAGNGLGPTLLSTATGTAKATLDSSPLKGVQSALDVISDPVRNGPRYLESLAGSTIPTLSGDVASMIDPLRRDVMGPLEAMKNKVPGLRQTLNPQLSVFGEPLRNQAYGIKALIDPFKMTEARTSSLSDEMRSLYQSNNGVLPSEIGSNFYGDMTKLNEKQRYDLTAKIHPEIKTAWERIIADPRYQQMSPADKKDILDKAAQDIRGARKYETGVEGGFLDPIEAQKKLTASQKALLAGSPNDYIAKEAAKNAPKVAKAKTAKVASAKKSSGGRKSSGRKVASSAPALRSQLAKIKLPSLKVAQIAAPKVAKLNFRLPNSRQGAKIKIKA